jgi:hypothetical protein
MSWTGALAPWLPAFLVLILGSVAVAAAGAMAAAATTKWLRMSATALLGGLAVAATVWQGRSTADRISAEEIHSAAQTEQIRALEGEINTLKQSTRRRTITGDTAAKLADYLRPFGTRQVMVSYAPNDIEAYHYATEIVNILKSANWDARGPEATTIFGDIKSMGINVYDISIGRSDTIKILLSGLTKLGIPYQSRVPPSEALPESETVELFISTKPTLSAAPVPDEAVR